MPVGPLLALLPLADTPERRLFGALMLMIAMISLLVSLHRQSGRTRVPGERRSLWASLKPMLLRRISGAEKHRPHFGLRPWKNPVVIKELSETIATRRALVIFAIFTGVMAVTVWLAWPRGDERLQNIDIIAQRLFQVVGLTMLTLVCLLAPAQSATAITGEKERDCFDLLVTSGVTPFQILHGKLVSALVFVGLLIFATAPMLSVCLLLGGISPFQLFALFLLLFEAALLFALIGLTASCLFERNNAALGVTYVVALPLLILMLGARDSLLTLSSAGLGLLLTLVVTAVALTLLSQRIAHPPEQRLGDEDEEDLEFSSAVMGLVLNRDLIPDRWIAPPRRTSPLPDGANPVLDKEVRSEIVGQGTLMLRVILQAGILMTIPFTFIYLFGQPAWYFAYLMIFTLLIAPSFVSGMLTGERENATFELLVTTLIEPRQVVMAKVTAGLRLVLLMLAIMVVPTVPGIVFGSAFYLDQYSVMDALWSVVLCLLWAGALVTISLLWSMVSRRTTAALVASYLTGAAIFIGPNLLHLVLRSFTSVETRWLESLLLLSPLTHLFLLTPGHIAGGLVPLGLGGHGFGASLLFGLGLLGITAGLIAAMVAVFERVWRRWVGFGA